MPRADLAAAAILAIICAPLGPLAAQDAVAFDQDSRQTVGDWVVECIEGVDPEPGACQIYQRVLTQDPNVAGMVVAVAWSPAETALRLQATLPLGADLRQPPVLRIDGDVIGSFAWTRCLENGCMVEAILTDEVTALLRDGVQASLTILQPTSGEIAIPLSLIGFPSALGDIVPDDALPAEEMAEEETPAD